MNKRVAFSEFLPLMEETLKTGGETVFTITGTSMLPLLKHRRDRVLLTVPDKTLNKYDIPLYRRKNGMFVLHRVVGVKEGDYVMCGDHQWQLEYPIRHDQVIGVVKGFWKGETYTPCTARRYKLYCRVWTALLPVRKYIFITLGFLAAVRRKLFERHRNT